IKKRNAVPEKIALRRPQEQGPLTDGELRLNADADKLWILELDRVPIGQTQFFESGPLLARFLDVLSRLVADRAGTGRLIGFGVLGATCCADEREHNYISLLHEAHRDMCTTGLAICPLFFSVEATWGDEQVKMRDYMTCPEGRSVGDDNSASRPALIRCNVLSGSSP